MKQKEVAKSSLGFDAALSAQDTNEIVIDGCGSVAAQADRGLNSTLAPGKFLHVDPGVIDLGPII
jgi:hypothetical protein